MKPSKGEYHRDSLCCSWHYCSIRNANLLLLQSQNVRYLYRQIVENNPKCFNLQAIGQDSGVLLGFSNVREDI